MLITLFDTPNNAVKNEGVLSSFHFIDEESEVQNIYENFPKSCSD